MSRNLHEIASFSEASCGPCLWLYKSWEFALCASICIDRSSFRQYIDRVKASLRFGSLVFDFRIFVLANIHIDRCGLDPSSSCSSAVAVAVRGDTLQICHEISILDSAFLSSDTLYDPFFSFIRFLCKNMIFCIGLIWILVFMNG